MNEELLIMMEAVARHCQSVDQGDRRAFTLAGNVLTCIQEIRNLKMQLGQIAALLSGQDAARLCDPALWLDKIRTILEGKGND